MITYPNLFHLRYFVDAVNLGSVSLASKKNSVSHPAVSRAISALESHLGLQLLEHKKKSFAVTKTGFEIAEQAQILLASVEGFYARNLTTDEGVTLRLGISRSLSEIYLTRILKKLKAECPKVRVQVKLGTTQEITEAVAQNTLDLGITIGANRLPTINSRIIQRGDFVLVSASGVSKPEHLQARSFILTEPRFETEALKRQFTRHFHHELDLAYEIESWSVISELVENGMGIGLIPDFILKSKKYAGCKKIKATWFQCGYETYLHSSKRSDQKRFVKNAVDLIENL